MADLRALRKLSEGVARVSACVPRVKRWMHRVNVLARSLV